MALEFRLAGYAVEAVESDADRDDAVARPSLSAGIATPYVEFPGARRAPAVEA